METEEAKARADRIMVRAVRRAQRIARQGDVDVSRMLAHARIAIRQASAHKAGMPGIYATSQEAIEAYRSCARDFHECPPPAVPGVYVFWNGAECQYVGMSENLRRRLQGHIMWRRCPAP